MDEQINPEITKPKKNWFKYLFIVFYILIIISIFFLRDAVLQQKEAFGTDPCGFCEEHCTYIEFGNGYIQNLSNTINETSFKLIILK